MSRPILQKENTNITTRLEDLRQSWKAIGYIVISDGWTNGKGKTLLTFLIHCPKGAMFIKSIPASMHIKGAPLLCELSLSKR